MKLYMHSCSAASPINLFLKKQIPRVCPFLRNGRAPVIIRESSSLPFRVEMLMLEVFYTTLLVSKSTDE